MEQVEVTVGNRWVTFNSYYPEALSQMLSFYAPGYYWSPKYRARDAEGNRVWDGKIKMLKRRRLPTGAFREFKKEAIQKLGITFAVHDEREKPDLRTSRLKVMREEAKTKEKRRYQVECLEALVKNSSSGGIVLCATGTGKTYIAGLYFKLLKGSGVFVVDELLLQSQAMEDLEKVLGERVGYVGNSKFKPRRITVATIQTLHRHTADPVFQEWIKKIDVMFLDEIHQAINKRNVDVVSKIGPYAVFGLTATLEWQKKEVRLKASGLCGPIIYRYPLAQGTKEKYLTPGVVLGINITRGMPEWGYQDLYWRRIVFSKMRNDCIEAILREGIKRGKYEILLLERVKHVKLFGKRLRDLPVATVFGEKSTTQRKISKNKFEAGKKRIIITNRVFKKGVSINRVDVITDGAAMRSKNDAMQKFGRGVRLRKNKYGLIYMDIGDKNLEGVVKGDPGWNRFERATRSRRKAFRAAGLTVVEVDWNEATPRKCARKAYDLAERKLKSVIKALKE